ncbi:MAG TPA: hypothetical protein ENH59_05530 [Bacteroidetes bacterium]|nr:hypothetical protein [Bacteroidota bacterium]
MKKILGLDLGTNSIGWALINMGELQKEGEIIRTGSRITPMSQDIINDFGGGNKVSKTAERTHFRSVRRLIERRKLRRERLLKVLKIIGVLYMSKIQFESNSQQVYFLGGGANG